MVQDAKSDELRHEVRVFIESVKPGDLAFVYYSGHGGQVKGNNYLLPMDLPQDATERYVEDEAVQAQRLEHDLEEQGAASGCKHRRECGTGVCFHNLLIEP